MWQFVLVVCFLFSLSHATLSDYEVIDISSIGWEKLEKVKSSLDCPWIELGDKLLTIHNSSEPLFIVSRVHRSELANLKPHTLLHHLGFAVVQAPKQAILADLRGSNSNKERKVELFNSEHLVLVRQSENVPPEPFTSFTSIAQETAVPIATLVSYVSSSRWFSDVQTLASFNRYTRGSGIATAQQWIISQLSSLANVNVTTQSFSSGATSGVNIIGTIKGTTTPDNWVIIGAHYDSTSQSPTTAAPGAEDDGSGTAAVLEIARVFSTYPPPSTVLLILYSGEEQGLLGSAAHAQSLVAGGDSSKLKLMHDMDMIAYQSNPSAQPQVILETTSAHVSLFPYYRNSATSFTTLGTFESTNAFGSDHESYLRRGMPALLTIDKDWDIYPSYHRTTDTPEKLNQNLGFQIVKLGVGAAAQALGYSF